MKKLICRLLSKLVPPEYNMGKLVEELRGQDIRIEALDRKIEATRKKIYREAVETAEVDRVIEGLKPLGRRDHQPAYQPNFYGLDVSQEGG